MITLPMTIGIASLFVHQVGCIWKNLTTIETFLDVRYKGYAKKSGMKKWVWFYDQGWKSNFKQVMGNSFKEWFLPIPSPIEGCNGIFFKTHNYARFSLLEAEDSDDVHIMIKETKKRGKISYV